MDMDEYFVHYTTFIISSKHQIDVNVILKISSKLSNTLLWYKSKTMVYSINKFPYLFGMRLTFSLMVLELRDIPTFRSF